MPILDLQRRLVEVGRIRLGAKKLSANGKEYPARLEQFRLTSRDRQRLDHAAALYGGQVKKWRDEWELFTDADALPVAVVPGQALSQSYELWGQKTLAGGKKSAVICLRRCDGVTEQLTGGACLCAQADEMVCKPTTRLFLVLADLPGLGRWRCESHGWNAASELAGSVELLEALTVARKTPVLARLRLDKREQKTESETRQFVVPVLDIDATLGQVLDAIGAAPAPAVSNGFTPVGALPAGPSVSVAEQVTVTTPPRVPRSNAAEPIRPTGLRPRTVEQVSSVGGGPVGGTTSALASAPDDEPDDGGALPLASRVAIWCNDVYDIIADTATFTADEFRHLFLKAFSEGRYSSAKDVTPGDIATLRAALVRLKRGELALVDRDGTPVLVVAATGLPTTDPGAQSPARRGGPMSVGGEDPTIARVPAPSPPTGPHDATWWRLQLEGVPGIGPVKLLKQARELAGTLELAAPSSLDELNDPALVDALTAWLEEQR